MKRALVLALSWAVLALPAFASELILNGDFERSYDDWTWTPGAGGYYESCNVRINYDPDSDYEVCLFRYDAAYTKLYQTVVLPHLNHNLSFQAKLQAVELNPTAPYWAFAGFEIEYRNASGAYLGRTIYAYLSPHCSTNLASSPTQHVVPVTDTLWHNYSFDLAAELINLPGVNPSLVQRATVAALDSTNGC